MAFVSIYYRFGDFMKMRKPGDNKKQAEMFKTKIVPGKPGSGNLFEEEFVVDGKSVECLGKTFENDEARRGEDSSKGWSGRGEKNLKR